MVVALKVLHIGLAAAWFGHKLLIPRDIDRAVGTQSSAEEFVRRMVSAERLGIASGLGTILSGAALVFATSGWSDVRAQIWIGLGAAVSMILIGGLVARPTWNRFTAGVDSEDLATASVHGRRFKLVLTIESSLWLVALTAMVF